jgi:hypothetical protein
MQEYKYLDLPIASHECQEEGEERRGGFVIRIIVT